MPKIGSEKFIVYTTKKYSNWRPMSELISAACIVQAQNPDEISVVFGSNKDSSETKAALKAVDCLSKVLSTPLSIGGISSMDIELSDLFAAGADKIIFNTNCFTYPQKVLDSSLKFGAQSIAACADIILIENNPFVIRGELSNINDRWSLARWLEHVLRLGVGEIIINSVDSDGTGIIEGIANVIDFIINSCPIPVVYGGGCKSARDFSSIFSAGAQGIMAGSYFLQMDQNINELRAQLINNGHNVRDV
jgi:cyclase